MRSPSRLLCVGALLLVAGCGREVSPSPPSSAAAPNASALSSSTEASSTEASSTEASSTEAPFKEAPFKENSAATGLHFVHFNGRTGDFHFAEMMGPGGALADLDGDGDLDVVLRQGRMLEAGQRVEEALQPPVHQPPFADRFFLNDLIPGGHLHFEDITTRALPRSQGPSDGAGYGMGIATGDVDGDGHIDLYLTNFGPNQLLRGRGDGTFEDVTAASGTGEVRWSVPAVFFDFDRDGDLDLYVGNYVALSAGTRKECFAETGARDYCGPAAFSAETDRLFANRGDGTFEDITAAAGLGAAAAPSLGAVAGDFNGDGWPDLYVANDGAANFLWMNRGDGTFEDQGLLAGCALNADGLPEASMGVDAADYDGDGDEDLFLAHLMRETNTVYRNDGRGLFTDQSRASGLAAPSLDRTAFGAAWVDTDNDGRLDLLSVNGAVKTLEALVRQGDPYPLHQINQLFHQEKDGRFREVTAQAGPAFELSEVSRGAAFGDVDNDGDVDVLIVNNGGPARLLVNRRGQKRSWVGLELSTAGRPALGAWVEIQRPGAASLWRRVRTAVSYASASDPRLTVGLGDFAGPVNVKVRWPDGRRETWPSLATGRYHALHQGQGQGPDPVQDPVQPPQ